MVEKDNISSMKFLRNNNVNDRLIYTNDIVEVVIDSAKQEVLNKKILNGTKAEQRALNIDEISTEITSMIMSIMKEKLLKEYILKCYGRTYPEDKNNIYIYSLNIFAKKEIFMRETVFTRVRNYIEENDSSFKEIVYENTERIINASKDKFDLVIFETLGSLKEGEFAVKKAKTLTDKPVICSFTLAGKKDIPNFIKNIVSTLETLGVDSLGINCTGYEEILMALDILKKNTNLPIMIKANLGIPKKVGEELIYEQTPEEFKNLSKRALEKGVNIIGGCCGTTPEYIRAICNLK